MSSGRRLLVVNADDFGLTPSVNRGIVETHLRGIVTSTSLMVNTPGWQDALGLLPTVPQLGVGLHVNFVLGRPLSRCPSLTDGRTGSFHSLRTLTLRALARQVDSADVERECSAQLDRLLAAGVMPTHIDSHRHTHALPGLFASVRKVATQAGVRHLRVPLESFRLASRRPHSYAKTLALHVALATIGVRGSSVRFAGTSITGNAEFLGRVFELIDRLPASGPTELMVHPGYASDELAAIDTYTSGREVETKALTDPGLRERLRVSGVELVTFAQV